MKIIYSIALIALTGCTTSSNDGCEKYMEYINGLQTNIILLKKTKVKFEDFILIGVDPSTNRDTVQFLPSRWFVHLKPLCDLGDTIVKRRGTSIIELHKTRMKYDLRQFDLTSTCGDYLMNGMSYDQWNQFQESYDKKHHSQ
ncbi:MULTISPECIES: hypothetical protein [Sphingobacterium]|uniref:hypothetical protein n=1 Tax=Sphingobacterium TaxID=28453 RepID=UPI00258072C7|nr:MULTISPECIES: hypothetical protein [Sphingobacterium]